MFSAASVCLFVCQHDNFGKSKHRMMKLEGRCIVQKYRPSSNLGSYSPGCAPPKMWRSGTTLRNQHRPSLVSIIIISSSSSSSSSTNRNTLCLEKVPTFKLSVTLSDLNQFSKILHC